MKNYLEQGMWERFLATYPDAQIEHIWEATWVLCDLFEEVAKDVGEQLGFSYHQQEARGSRCFLEQVYRLPKDAKEIF